MNDQWLDWARRLQSIAQTGLHYAENTFDRDRYGQIREIAAEMMSSQTPVDKETLMQIFKKEEGYATPKVDVRGVVFRGDKILMIKEWVDEKWTLPGGWADVTMSPRENVEREVWEETGFETKAKRLLAVYDRSLHGHEPPYPFHLYKMFFLCEIYGGEARCSNESLAVDFFGLDELPELSAGRITEEQIQRMFELRHRENVPCDFD